MKMKLTYIFLTIILLCIYSCQKEYSFEGGQVSTGSLKNQVTGQCLPDKVNGIYTVGKALSDTNYIEVTVNVTQPGFYSITTNAVNGFFFSATGSFSNTGSNIVKLAGSGKPVAQGNNNFAITYDTSVCNIIVAVEPTETTTPAVFTLQGSPNSCMVDTVFGNYVENIVLTNTSYVKIGVDVTTRGTYNISTNAVNGYSFSASGIFGSMGIQTITLTASGTPLLEGVNVFTITAGPSSCTFPVTVLHPLAVTNNDHFPLTYNSYWTYDDLLSPGDTLKRTITDSVLTAGNVYKNFEEKPMIAPPAEYLFRKAGDNYYEYGSVDKYTSSLKFNPELDGEILFLKENLTTGNTWMSDEYISTVTGGQTIYLQYDFSCLDANATISINGKTFINVYQIQMKPTIRSAITNPYVSTGEIYNVYYAKGVGLIYNKETSLGSALVEFRIRNWLVN